MTDQPEEQKPESANSITNVSGGVNANAERIDIGGDVVGRDKILHITNNYYAGGEATSNKLKTSHNLSRSDRDEIVGRDDIIAELQSCLADPAYSLVVLEGAPGMGKSSVAREVARRCLESGQYDTCVWWSGNYETRTLSALLDEIQRVLGHSPDNAALTEQYSNFYQLLSSQRCLLVVVKITQKHHAEILRFLKGTLVETGVLVTTVSPLPAGKHVRLGPLADSAAIQLLRYHIANQVNHPWQNYSDTKLMPLVTESSGSPVALALAVGLAPSILASDSLGAIVQRLKSGVGDFRELCADLYTKLAIQAQTALNLICLSQESISGEALARTLTIRREVVEDQILPDLHNMGLISFRRELSGASISFTPAYRLVREYCRIRLRDEQPGEERRLRDGLADYYSEACQRNGYENWNGHDWLEQNVSELLAILEWYHQTQQWFALVKMFNALYYFMGVHGYWQQRLDWSIKAIQAARLSGDMHSEALLLVRVLGRTESQMGQLEQAREHLQTGLRMLIELGDHSGAASALRYLGTIERRRHSYAQAETYYQDALLHAAQAPDRERLVAGIQLSFSMLYQKTSRYDNCEQRLRSALEIFQRLNHQPKVAEVLSRLGDVMLLQQQVDKAESLYQDSERQLAGVDRAKTRAYNRIGLAQLAEQRGQLVQAQTYAEEARKLFGNLGLANEANESAILHRLAAFAP
jgi:tetratricopeptide (TPR) repeat protein